MFINQTVQDSYNMSTF